MKSRTSYFDKTIFRKNLTRFAPAWGLYTVFLLMALVTLIGSGSRWFATNVCDFVHIHSVISPCYALLCAQLLFGDLYNSRMCNALHALPLRRETWFGTHVASGFTFHLIPTVIFTVLAALYALLAGHEGDWFTAVIWLLGVNLQFACFFGIAVLSAFCVGSRFAQAVIYGILNFGSLILGWLVDTIFVPMYYGIKINMEPFFWFSPVGQMLQNPFCEHTQTYYYDEWRPGTLEIGENFYYYFIVAAIGIALLVAALQLYRRRKLECAGDFMALRGMEPVFLVVYTIIVGAVFHFASDEIFGLSEYLFLFIGFAVGWFTGKMLLERTTRVFRLKNVLRCGTLIAVCGLVLIITALDPFGIERWVPETDDVESVTIADGHYSYHNAELTLEDREDIRRIIAIHEETLEDYRDDISHEAVFTDVYDELILEQEAETMNFSSAFTLTYQLKNGRTVKRYYNIWLGDETGLYLKELFSRPEAVLDFPDVEEFLKANNPVVVTDTWVGNDTYVFSQADIRGLYDAILADCAAGTMAQQWDFHSGVHSLYWVHSEYGLDITVYSDCENTVRWLRDNGFDVDELRERKEEFG